MVGVGISDISTTHPDLVKYFLNQEDAKKYSHQSEKHVDLKCPDCGFIFTCVVANLTTNGFHCSKCSDGESYANKFARNLFSQLSEQYDYYEFEWSPDLAGKYSYDNYIELKDGTKLIVEMDGGQHYKSVDYFGGINNDKAKDELARENGIKMIRINCDYPKPTIRFEYIKSNIQKSLNSVFDLSFVDWNQCNKIATNSNIIRAIEEYNKKSICFKSKTCKTAWHFP